jgi:hypothetical protein
VALSEEEARSRRQDAWIWIEACSAAEVRGEAGEGLVHQDITGRASAPSARAGQAEPFGPKQEKVALVAVIVLAQP